MANELSNNNVLLGMVSLGHQAGVEQLLATGRYDVNYVNDNGDTGLSIAARRNDLEMMQFLVSSGADINIGMGREHLISTAQLHGNQEMLNWLNSINKLYGIG